MNKITLLAQTPDTVTISRADLERLVEAAQDAQDLAHILEHKKWEASVGGPVAAQKFYVTSEEVERLFAGESPVRVWREKRGLSQRALADLANIRPGYLSEIETRKKPGSLAAYRALAQALDIKLDDLAFDYAAP